MSRKRSRYEEEEEGDWEVVPAKKPKKRIVVTKKQREKEQDKKRIVVTKKKREKKEEERPVFITPRAQKKLDVNPEGLPLSQPVTVAQTRSGRKAYALGGLKAERSGELAMTPAKRNLTSDLSRLYTAKHAISDDPLMTQTTRLMGRLNDLGLTSDKGHLDAVGYVMQDLEDIGYKQGFRRGEEKLLEIGDEFLKKYKGNKRGGYSIDDRDRMKYRNAVNRWGRDRGFKLTYPPEKVEQYKPKK